MTPSQFDALAIDAALRDTALRDTALRRAAGHAHVPHRYLLRFESLFHAGRGLSFPCDERGQVLLDLLSDQARANYLFARAVVGHEYATPVIRCCDE